MCRPSGAAGHAVRANSQSATLSPRRAYAWHARAGPHLQLGVVGIHGAGHLMHWQLLCARAAGGRHPGVKHGRSVSLSLMVVQLRHQKRQPCTLKHRQVQLPAIDVQAGRGRRALHPLRSRRAMPLLVHPRSRAGSPKHSSLSP